jgi:hypothetical protein
MSDSEVASLREQMEALQQQVSTHGDTFGKIRKIGRLVVFFYAALALACMGGAAYTKYQGLRATTDFLYSTGQTLLFIMLGFAFLVGALQEQRDSPKP